MSIVPASSLSSSDLTMLGNNVGRPAKRVKPRSKDHQLLAAVNRSLARLGESVAQLHQPTYLAS